MGLEKPVVSILMSVYKPDINYLTQTLDSIENQTYKNIELILVHDGSDGTDLGSLLSRYSFRSELIENETNLGLAKSLNRGVLACNGKYIARIDADDSMASNRIEEQLQYMESNAKIVAVFSNAKRILPSGEMADYHTSISNEQVKRILMTRGNCLIHSTLFVRTWAIRSIDGYDERMTYAQDYDLYLRLLDIGDFYLLPEKLILFREGGDNTPIQKRLLSCLFAYYATLMYLYKKPNLGIFVSRTLITINTVWKELKR